MQEIVPQIFTWNTFNHDKGLNFNGYYIPKGSHSPKSVMIDPVALNQEQYQFVTERGGVEYIILTNVNHLRGSFEIREKYQSQMLINRADAPLLENIKADKTFEDGDLLAGYLIANQIKDNKSPGETSLYWAARKILFLGDALVSHHQGKLNLLAPEKYKNIKKTEKGLRMLLNLDFDILLLGDGYNPLEQGRHALEAFFEEQAKEAK